MYGATAALSGEVAAWSRAHLSFEQRACAPEAGEAAVLGATSAGGQQVPVPSIWKALARLACVL